ncbi:MAG: photosynthetic reaction center cytochrome c subunit family protein [Vicinamibacterales bacterium]
MKLVCAAAITLAFAMSAGLAAQDRPQVAENVFKNIQVLKGLPVDDFMDTMGIMSAALGFDCSECHMGAGTDTVKWEADTDKKRTARRMTLMVAAINRTNFGGRQVVTCWTCHRGRDVPSVMPSIDTVYGTPVLEADDIIRESFPGEPSADQILDKYVQALGGAQRLSSVTSFVATWTSLGFRGFGGGGAVQIFAKAPDQRASIIRFADSIKRQDAIRAFDGRNGWVSAPLAVVPEYALGGSELDGARLDAQLSFPAQIKTALSQLRVGPPDNIEGRDVHVVQGNGARGLVATLYFDKESGLLVRMLRLGSSPIGRAPTQVDFADYREVAGAGIKMPFRWTFGWLDGRDSFELKEIRINVPIDPGVFARPAPVVGQAKEWVPPLTAYGKPDLQGMWLNISATPLERPALLAGRPFLTDEEVVEFKRRAARLFDLDSNADFPGGDTFFQALLENPGKFTNPNATGSVSVMIEREIENRTSLIVDPADGRIPPMTAEGRTRLARSPTPNAAGRNTAAGPEDLSNAMRCITYGMPRIGVQNINAAGPLGYYQILQTPAHVTLTLEAIHETRIIPLEGRPPLPQTMRQWTGDSRGHWEGNTLVVETTNFSPSSRFMGSADNLRILERFSRVEADTVNYEITVDDPTTWTKPWTVLIRLRRTQDKIYEYACHEGNYHTMEGILGAARADEREGSK